MNHDCQYGCNAYKKIKAELEELKKQPYKCKPTCCYFKVDQELDKRRLKE